jgi:hypothetical protein
MRRSTILKHNIEIIGLVRSQGVSFGLAENIGKVAILLRDVLELHRFWFC